MRIIDKADILTLVEYQILNHSQIKELEKNVGFRILMNAWSQNH